MKDPVRAKGEKSCLTDMISAYRCPSTYVLLCPNPFRLQFSPSTYTSSDPSTSRINSNCHIVYNDNVNGMATLHAPLLPVCS